MKIINPLSADFHDKKKIFIVNFDNGEEVNES